MIIKTRTFYSQIEMLSYTSEDWYLIHFGGKLVSLPVSKFVIKVDHIYASVSALLSVKYFDFSLSDLLNF